MLHIVTPCIVLAREVTGERQEFHLSTEITREMFNEAVRPLVEQSSECIRQAISEAQIDMEDVDRIILVGGSTRAPCVRTLVTEMFGKEPYGDFDPATAVSQGAGILGAETSGETSGTVRRQGHSTC